MIDTHYVLYWTFRHANGNYYYSHCKHFENENDLNLFWFDLLHREDIEVIEWSKEYTERWVKG